MRTGRRDTKETLEEKSRSFAKLALRSSLWRRKCIFFLGRKRKYSTCTFILPSFYSFVCSQARDAESEFFLLLLRHWYKGKNSSVQEKSGRGGQGRDIFSDFILDPCSVKTGRHLGRGIGRSSPKNAVPTLREDWGLAFPVDPGLPSGLDDDCRSASGADPNKPTTLPRHRDAHSWAPTLPERGAGSGRRLFLFARAEDALPRQSWRRVQVQQHARRSPIVWEEETERAASQPDGTKQDRCGGGGGGGGGREDRPECSSPARFTLTLQHETHETAIDCKNTTGQPEETKHDECGDSKRLMNHLWLDRRREILFLSISLLGHFIVSEEVTWNTTEPILV